MRALLDYTESKSLQAVFQASQDATVFSDPAGRVLWCNAGFETLTGYTLDDLKGQRLDRLYPRDEDLHVPGRVSGAPLDNDARYLMTYVHKCGAIIETETTSWSVPTDDGRLALTVRVLRDRTADNRIVNVKDRILSIITEQRTTGTEQVEALLSVGCEFFHMPVGLVCLFRDERLTVRHAKSTLAAIPPGVSFDIGADSEALGLSVNRPTQIQLEDPAPSHPLLPGLPIRSCINAPLIIGGERIGLVSFLNPLRNIGFSSEAIGVLSSIARHISLQVAQERRMRALERAATQDWLTGAGSNRQFRQNLAATFKMARRNGSTASLILFDIDHFKSVNDSFGHDMGDRVLTEISTRVQALLAPRLKLYRVGGEEFAIILPGSQADQAAILAETLRAELSNAPDMDDELPRVTASFGVAELDPDLPSEDPWVKCADLALYASKNQGRNRVTSTGQISGVDLPESYVKQASKKHSRIETQNVAN